MGISVQHDTCGSVTAATNNGIRLLGATHSWITERKAPASIRVTAE